MNDPYKHLQTEYFDLRNLIPKGTYFDMKLKKIGREDSYVSCLQYLRHAQLILDRPVNIIELGTTRGPLGGGPPGDGWATQAWGWYAKKFDATVHTVDFDPVAIEYCKLITAEYQDHITYTVSDSVEFIKNFDEPIDFLFLDSGNDHQLMLNEFMAAKDKLHDRSIVLLDDCNYVTSTPPGKTTEIVTVDDPLPGRPKITGPKALLLVPYLRGTEWKEIYYINSQMLWLTKTFIGEIQDGRKE
jgi:hypothetical protein